MEKDDTFENNDNVSNDDVRKAINTVLSVIPEDAKQNEEVEQSIALIVSQTIIKKESFRGPIPHPELFSQYEKALPGACDRIMQMAEKQQHHRMELEKESVKGQLKSNSRGQVFGFIFTLVALGFACFLVYLGLTVVGIIAFFLIVLGLAALFLGGKVSMLTDLKEKKISMKTQGKKE